MSHTPGCMSGGPYADPFSPDIVITTKATAPWCSEAPLSRALTDLRAAAHDHRGGRRQWV
jgi:hypothetical protein